MDTEVAVLRREKYFRARKYVEPGGRLMLTATVDLSPASLLGVSIHSLYVASMVVCRIPVL